MFTGIVEEVGQVISISSSQLSVSAGKITECLALGDSMDVNGICLTVTDFDRKHFVVDIMEETFSRTALKYLNPGDSVNLERAITLQKPLGGHLVQGHVDDVGEVESINHLEEAVIFRINAPRYVMRYIVEKGFIAMDGISLTVTARDADGFAVSIVKFTWANTRLSQLRPGDKVNLEADIIAKYVEQLSVKQADNLTLDFLKEHGFLNH